ncbi:MAG: hypothetical protein GY868_13800, partial [Deltaproteobacteria bacterium]|nr:hypothetical protein [Deltaproteobacteria bacterium]
NGPFTSNGQVRQVLTNDYGYSDETVDKFIDYIAVLSYVDSQVYKNDNYNPHDSGFVTRAPININTAPELVIKAALDGIAHVEQNNAENLARDIVAHRESVGPFTSISSTAEEINSLLNFVWGKRFAGSYSSFIKSDVGFINDNADPSRRDHYANHTDDENTTEFTISSTTAPYNSFIITSTGTVGEISRTVTRTVHIDSSGNIKFDVPLPEGGTANSWEAVVEN